jgi:hypothetical protein
MATKKPKILQFEILPEFTLLCIIGNLEDYEIATLLYSELDFSFQLIAWPQIINAPQTNFYVFACNQMDQNEICIINNKLDGKALSTELKKFDLLIKISNEVLNETLQSMHSIISQHKSVITCVTVSGQDLKNPTPLLFEIELVDNVNSKIVINSLLNK